MASTCFCSLGPKTNNRKKSTVCNRRHFSCTIKRVIRLDGPISWHTKWATESFLNLTRRHFFSFFFFITPLSEKTYKWQKLIFTNRGPMCHVFSQNRPRMPVTPFRSMLSRFIVQVGLAETRDLPHNKIANRYCIPNTPCIAR